MNNFIQNQRNGENAERTKEAMVMNWMSRFMVWKFHKKEEIKEILSNNKGLGIVEIALIIVVIVALAFLFKDKIGTMLGKILDSANTDGLGEKYSN